ncbi:MAG: hypothetical protein EWM72_03425 [Nitrospira sp.]|nr:MAG: hypothetical protein EWM72_03425 [Nitrospira sp.]
MRIKSPLYNSRKELDIARQAIDGMRCAQSFIQFEQAWQDFLVRLERAWNKTKDVFSDSQYAPWRGQHEHMRNSDQLLRYLKQARDAEEHTVCETISKELGGIGINPSSGNSLHIEHMTINRGKITIRGAKPGIAVTVYLDRVKLMPAISRGVVTLPPEEHLGQPFYGTNPMEVAEAGLIYYERMIRDAMPRFGIEKEKERGQAP